MKSEKILWRDIEIENGVIDGLPVAEQEKKVKLHVVKESKSSRKINTVIWVVLIFIAFFTIITRFSQMINLTYEIADLKGELKAQNAVNSTLSVELDKKTNIIKIRHTAETEFGMHEPDSQQIVYIEVPRANNVIVAKEPDGPNIGTKGIFDIIKGFIFGVN